MMFDTASMHAVAMQLQRKYAGARIQFEARLGSARVPMQLDLGFGDVVTPHPQAIEYPVLLDFPQPKLRGYPPETVMAEKLQTIVEKGAANTRIKDFYDIWLLLHQWSFRPIELQKAID